MHFISNYVVSNDGLIGVTKENHGNLGENNRSPRRDLTPRSLDYDAGVLTTL